MGWWGCGVGEGDVGVVHGQGDGEVEGVEGGFVDYYEAVSCGW